MSPRRLVSRASYHTGMESLPAAAIGHGSSKSKAAYSESSPSSVLRRSARPDVLMGSCVDRTAAFRSAETRVGEGV